MNLLRRAVLEQRRVAANVVPARLEPAAPPVGRVVVDGWGEGALVEARRSVAALNWWLERFRHALNFQREICQLLLQLLLRLLPLVPPVDVLLREHGHVVSRLAVLFLF